jgi:tripartite-type tricarboxylate transporter receptor subunit TctC
VKLADKFNLSAAVTILLLLVPHAPHADEFPTHPLKLLVGAPAGGTTDTIARAIAEPMAAALKQPVLVENRPEPAAIWPRPPSQGQHPTDTRCW